MSRPSPTATRVLLVEDDPLYANLVKELLTWDLRWQLALSWCDHLSEALEQLSREPFDVILLDMSLPDSQGLKTLERILDTVETVPVVVVTGAEDEELANQAILHGAQDYLVKGTFDGRAMNRAIHYAIDRKRAEAARSRLAAIVEFSEDAIIGEQLDGTITSWNSGAERIFGYSAEEVIGRSISLLTPPDRAAEAADVLDRIRRAEHVGHFETQRIRKDGQPIHVSLSVSPIKEMETRVIGASVIARDITESKRIREEREKLLCELQQAMSKVKLLSGLIPICANCKKIRDDKGYWNHVEVYIRTHSEADFTHGICPTCLQELYPELGKPPEE